MVLRSHVCQVPLWLVLIIIHYEVSPRPFSQQASSKLKGGEYPSGQNHLETLSWAVELTLPLSSAQSQSNYDAIAEAVAKSTGLTNEGQIATLMGHYLFTHEIHSDIAKKLKDKHLWYGIKDQYINKTVHSAESETADKRSSEELHAPCNRTCDHSVSGKPVLHDLVSVSHDDWKEHIQKAHVALDSNVFVKSYRQEVIRMRLKRSISPNDPAFPRQWHLVNRINPRYDINVTGVWASNITGVGITAAVVDDGLQWRNADILDNYSPEGSWDLNSNDPDPSPHGDKEKNHHGTRCAGEIAAVANNNNCGVGVAYGAKVAGIRVLDGPMTDSLEATAFLKNHDVNDVYSCSWGPDDDGKTVDGPHYLATTALRHGVDYGRKGYGAIYVVASGNGGRYGDNCNFDGYANSIYTITIGAVDELGRMPYYAEECASMLAVTFSSGNGVTRSIVTADWTKDGGTGCTDDHTGTSAAAPIAAGLIALLLSARPCLTWRDVQHIIIMSAVKVDVDIAHWYTNKAGFHHSHKHGFGLMDAWRLVNAAKVWKRVPWMTVYTAEKKRENAAIPVTPNKLQVTFDVTEDMLSGYTLFTLEYVQVSLTITHRRRGDLMIWLLCPSGTMSVLAATRKLDDSKDGFVDWTFSTVRCWGEEPAGPWTLIATDKGGEKESGGNLIDWTLKLFGSPMSPEDIQERRRLVKEANSGKFLNENGTCDPPPFRAKFVAPITDKTLKILVLISTGCLFMAVYELLEYTFCYDEEKKEHQKQLKLAVRSKASSPDGSEETPTTSAAGEASELTRLLDAEEIPLDEPSSFACAQVSGYATAEAGVDSGAAASGVEENVVYDRDEGRANVFVDVDIHRHEAGGLHTSTAAAGRQAANTQVTLNSDIAEMPDCLNSESSTPSATDMFRTRNSRSSQSEFLIGPPTGPAVSGLTPQYGQARDGGRRHGAMFFPSLLPGDVD